MEISGICNARCKFCSTGNGETRNQHSKFSTALECKSLLTGLLQAQQIDRTTTILLYNWGEPFLNPELIKILEVITDLGNKYILSTNGSIYLKIPKPLLKNLGTLIISMPGFSESSYKKIHGFSFEKILDNINRFIKDIPPYRVEINFHIYTFNKKELTEACNYFKDTGISINTYYAYFNSHDLSRRYLMDKMIEIPSDLCLDYVKDHVSSLKTGTCPQKDTLTFDEFGNRLRCCGVSKNNTSYLYESPDICQECLSLGIAAWGNNVKTPKWASEILSDYSRSRYFPTMKFLFTNAYKELVT